MGGKKGKYVQLESLDRAVSNPSRFLKPVLCSKMQKKKDLRATTLAYTYAKKYLKKNKKTTSRVALIEGEIFSFAFK